MSATIKVRSKKYRNYSPNLYIFAAILSLNDLILADLLSCHPLSGVPFLGE
jgi:hypothetical protein